MSLAHVRDNLKIIEDYFRDKPLWHELSEEEAKELYVLLCHNPAKQEEKQCQKRQYV